MIKARNKKLSLILVLAMVMTMFAGLGTAAASSSFSTSAVPTIPDDTEDAVSLATILATGYGIDASSATAVKDVVDPGFVVKLPEGFEITKIAGQDVKDGDGNVKQVTLDILNTEDDIKGIAIGAQLVDDNSFGVQIVAVGESGAVDNTTVTQYIKKIEFAIPVQVKAPSSVPAEVRANILGSPGTTFGDSSVVVAKGGEGAVQAIPGDPISVSSGASNTVKITVRATTDKALEDLTFTLPAGFYWTGATFGNKVLDVYAEDESRKVKFDNNDLATPLGKGIYRFEGTFEVDETKARFGDVVVDLSGSSVQPGALIIGSYDDFGVELTNGKVADVLAGRTNVEIGDIVIKEKAAGSLVEDRSVYLTLPDGARWISADINSKEVQVKDEDGDPAYTTKIATTSKDNVAKFTISKKSGKKGEIKIKNAKIAIAPDFIGDLNVEVSGSAGVAGNVNVAKVAAPVTVSSDVKDVKIGLQSQAGGNIVITEAEAEAIMEGDIILEAPANCEWAKIPTAKIIEGNIELDTITKDGNILTITVKEASSKASKIELSDVAWTIDRTVPEGDMKVTVKGGALTELKKDAEDSAYEAFTNRDKVTSFVAANVITPAPGDVANVAVFNYGETSYLLNGAPVQMDVAPYAKNNRTYVPVRYCANALGISDNNIIWDQQNKTVTMMKGDKVVQLKLGSNIMTINGVDVRMDVVVEAQNGRTFLPAAWVAQAFGAKAVWDPANPNTVTVSY